MKILTVDTSTNIFSVALSADAALLAESVGEPGVASSATIALHVEKVMAQGGVKLDDVDAFAVTIGPGAFTGVRVGISFVKGLALALGRPVIPISSLELLAFNASTSLIPVCPMFDARKGEVYAALYAFGTTVEELLPEVVAPPQKFVEQLPEGCLFIGDGALRYADVIRECFSEAALFASAELHVPQASAARQLVHARLAEGKAISPHAILPRYLRLSEAELNKKQ